MSRWSMRAASAVILAVFVQLALPQPVLAQSAARHNSSRGTSTTKRVVWSLIGAGVGFGVGAMFGLHKFDDATNSDRKVTISAITGAVIGGLAGGFLSRDGAPSFVPKRPPFFKRSLGRAGDVVRVANPLRSGPAVFFEVH